MRIAIASHLMSEELRQVIMSEPEYEIAWVARNGADAIQKCIMDAPDLALLDPNLPLLDGVEVTRRIMEDAPCPILLVTDTVDGNAAKVFEAMGSGALDVVSVNLTDKVQSESSRIALLKKINTLKKLTQPSSKMTPVQQPHVPEPSTTIPRLIVIGSSAGGPKTLAAILSKLPQTSNVVIIIVQHVDKEFSVGLAEWLDAQSLLPVRLAMVGERPKPGYVYLAATNDHLIFTSRLTFSYTPEPRETPYRPSVDVLFKSAAKYWPSKGHAILLTGMGRDGAEGLAVLRKAGWHTIAQDQATSVVYGMPKAAKELGAAVEILSLEDIVIRLVKTLASK